MILLASASQARRALLASVRLPHTVEPSGVREGAAAADAADPHAFVRRLARRKAHSVAVRVAVRAAGASDTQGGAQPPLVLGCDTGIYLDGTILGKPTDALQAADFLRRLSGREHRVITGLCLLDAADGGMVGETSAETTVLVRSLRRAEREWYVRTGEWSGAAGGYRVQGQGAFLLERIEGSYSNVVGLPLDALYGILSEIDYFGTR